MPHAAFCEGAIFLAPVAAISSSVPQMVLEERGCFRNSITNGPSQINGRFSNFPQFCDIFAKYD
jgi:hypothetical protein